MSQTASCRSLLFVAMASLAEFDDQRPIGDFALALPVAHRPFVVLTAGFLDFVVNRRIAEVFSARITRREWG